MEEIEFSRWLFEGYFFHIFGIPSSSRHEKRCQILQTLFWVFQYSKNSQCFILIYWWDKVIFVLYSVEVLLLTWTYFYVLSDQKWPLHALLNSKRTESVKVQMVRRVPK